jgi:hypothetical protein
MRVINVIETKDGIVDKITSFGIFEEQLSSVEVNRAEELFVAKLEECCVEDAHIEGYIEDGFYQFGDFAICLTWSEI